MTAVRFLELVPAFDTVAVRLPLPLVVAMALLRWAEGDRMVLSPPSVGWPTEGELQRMGAVHNHRGRSGFQ